MRPHPSLLGCFLLSILLSSGTASAVYRGYVEPPWTPTFCQQESHFLDNPCSGTSVFLEEYIAIDLNRYLCTYVVLDGPDVGIECQVIQPQSITPATAPCPIRFGVLRLTGDPAPQIYWDHVICAASYDLIRGDLGNVRNATTTTDLGDVTCLAEDVPQPDWWAVYGPSDPESPPVGHAFFYLARAGGLPYGDMTYGFSSDALEERPATGDCVP